MINLDSLKQFDLKQFDLGRLDPRHVDLPTFELPTFELPTFELPKFELPKFELPTFELPKYDLPTVEVPAPLDRVAGLARDAAYVGIGAVVVTAQKADERRRALTDQVGSNVRKLVGATA